MPTLPVYPDLASLHLTCNHLGRVPPTLAAATSLTELSLACNTTLALTAADADGVLSHLPELRRLYLDVHRVPPQVLSQLSERAPQLQVSRLPPSLLW